MLEFAVQVKGLHNVDDGQAAWVLAVDPEAGVLIEHSEDRSMHWHPLEDCIFARLMKPDAPRAVFSVQPAQKPNPIMVPNRAARRELERNGPG